MGRKRGGGAKDSEMLSAGFINCRGWCSREVDVKALLGLKTFDVLELAETFLKRKGEVMSMTGYEWLAGIEIVLSGLVLVWECWYIRIWNRETREGVVWVELRGVWKKMMVGVVYVNPEGVGSERRRD